jgi:hypothetical protein
MPEDGFRKIRHLLSGLAIAHLTIADVAGLLRASTRIIVIGIAQTLAFRLAIVAALLLLGGCAATKIINQWSNPNYSAASFKRILVIGVSKQASIRRAFEDEFVAQLRAISIDAVPSYEFIPEDGQVLESRLKESVKRAGADGAIITRLVRVERKADVPDHTARFQGSVSIDGTPPLGLAFMNRRAWTSMISIYRKRGCTTLRKISWCGAASPRRPSSVTSEKRSRNMSRP